MLRYQLRFFRARHSHRLAATELLRRIRPSPRRATPGSAPVIAPPATQPHVALPAALLPSSAFAPLGCHRAPAAYSSFAAASNTWICACNCAACNSAACCATSCASSELGIRTAWLPQSSCGVFVLRRGEQHLDLRL